jgi:phosphatidate cytidylyltransferase
MTRLHWQILLIYVVGLLVAALLGSLRRGNRPKGDVGSLWHKFPSYIAMNATFLIASWLSPRTHVLTAVLCLLGALAAWEIAGALEAALLKRPDGQGGAGTNSGAGTSRIWMVLMAAATTVLVAGADWLEPAAWAPVLLGAVVFSAVAAAIVGGPERYAERALGIAGCLAYVPICLAAYVWIWKGDPSGFRAVFLYLVVATNDAMAQITGELFGSHALAPRISPAKTVEGAMGGMLFAGLVGGAAGYVLGWGYLTGIGLGLLAGVSGLAGDLTASVWKRALGIKAFSARLGAHGGILDRFDGLLLAAPVFFIVTSMLLG